MKSLLLNRSCLRMKCKDKPITHITMSDIKIEFHIEYMQAHVVIFTDEHTCRVLKNIVVGGLEEGIAPHNVKRFLDLLNDEFDYIQKQKHERQFS